VKGRKAQFVVLGILLAVLAGIGVWHLVPVMLFRSVLEKAVKKATGLHCDLGDGRPMPGRDFQTDRFCLGPPDSPVLEVDEPVLGFDSRGVLTRVFLGRKRVVLNHPDWPRLELKDLYLAYIAGELHLSLQCTDLNPLLKKYGKVRFERGSLIVNAPLDLSRPELDCSVSIRLSNIEVRSLDGKFEFEAEEVAATVKVTGTLKNPRFDLGGLEPYLGEKFVESFKEYKP